MKFQNNRIPKYTKSLITSEHTSFLLSIALRYYVLIKKQLQLLITSQHSSTIELFPSISLVFIKKQLQLLTTSQQSNSSYLSLLSSTRRTSEDSIAINNLSDSSRIIYSSIARYLSIPPFTSWKITFVRIAFILLVNYLHLTHQYSSTLNFSLPGK